MKLREIAELVGGELMGDGDIEITSVADISRAQPGQLAFCEKYDDIPETAASCVLVSVTPSDVPGGNVSVNERGSDNSAPQAETRPVARVSVIVTKNPKLAFANAAQKLVPYKRLYEGGGETLDPTAIRSDPMMIKTGNIGKFVTIGEDSYIGEGSQIGDGVRIGNNVEIDKHVIIHQNCVIYDNVRIGRGSILHAGVVIGADGFGYVKDENGEYVKFPQIGTVVIEDYVEIGANTCIDRGALGETRIGEGTKIDNLVQVGHNVNIGKRCVIAAQTGISGSVTIEDDCVIGGQVGFGDHVTVKSGAVIGSQAGVLPGKIVRPGVWWGTPIQPLDEYKRQNAMVKGLERLRDQVKELRKRDED
jgi:UDP-3-O-[3-hydroxymyristoyl] glucosamine N-acyltransferase